MQNEKLRFEVDFMLGKLAKTLRVLGFDTKYVKYCKSTGSFGSNDILADSLKESRILVTRTHKFPKISNVFVIKSEELLQQLKELDHKFKIRSHMNPFSRCLICNSILETVRKSEVKSKVPFYVYQTHREFGYCRECNKFYWKGTHYKAIVKRVKKLL
ncbi:MAG: Mut7-C RNAse domain-containing protein [bacterium]|nr:Mut7-C RNAse domain-containing protein [bacterium]